MSFPIIIHIDFPALDRLVAWLENRAQAEIDALTQRIGNLNSKETAALKAAE